MHGLTIILFYQGEQVLDDLHVSGTEAARGSMPVHIALGRMMIDRICATIRLEDAVGAASNRLIAGSLKHLKCRIAGEEHPTSSFMEVAKTEGPILHFSQHPRFVRCVHIAIVVVDQYAPRFARRRLHVDVPRSMRSQYFREKNLRVDLGDAVAAPVYLENVCQALFIKIKEAPHFVSGAVACFYCEPVWADWSQED